MQTPASSTREISRINLGGGWYVTPNILAKAEYGYQNYSGDGWTGQTYQEAQFSGFMIEGAVSF